MEQENLKIDYEMQGSLKLDKGDSEEEEEFKKYETEYKK